MVDEIVDIIDENDQILSQTTRKEAFLQKLRCRVVHCFLIDRETGELILIIRSRNASFRPLHYAIIGGYVQSGETALQGMAREMREEAGVAVDLRFLEQYPFTDDNNGQIFMDHVYAAYVDGAAIRIDPNDVEETVRLTLADLRDLIARGSPVHVLLPAQLAVLERHRDALWPGK